MYGFRRSVDMSSIILLQIGIVGIEKWKHFGFLRLRLFQQTVTLDATFSKAFTWYQERTYAYKSSHLKNSNLYFVSNQKLLLEKSSFQISFLKLILKRFWVFNLVQSSKMILEFSSKPTKYWSAHLKLILRSYGNTMKSLKD